MRSPPTRSRLALLVAAALGPFAQVAQAEWGRTARVVLPEATVIPVRLDTALSSATSLQGDWFTATVQSTQDGDAELPLGTQLRGQVAQVQRAADGQLGMLDVSFSQVLLANGQKLPAEGSLISLDEKNTQMSNGRLVATPTNRKSGDRTKFIAIVAGAGLVLGKLTKHTLEGALLGALAGYLYSESQNKVQPTDVAVAAGSVFGVRLDRELAYSASRAFVAARDRYRRVALAPAVDAPLADIRVVMNGRGVAFLDNKPLDNQGIVLVSLAPVMQEAQVPYNYDEGRQTVRVDTKAGALYLKVGRSYALLEGERENVETPALLRGGEVFVPLHFLALATEMPVLWDAGTRTVTLTSARPVAVALRDIRVIMDGRVLAFADNQPFEDHGLVLVQLAPVMSGAQVPYEYDAPSQTVVVGVPTGELHLKIGRSYALLEGERQDLETPAQVRGGEVFVPLHFLALATGTRVLWDSRSRIVTMTSPTHAAAGGEASPSLVVGAPSVRLTMRGVSF